MRKDQKPRIVDAYCGVGGMTRGLQEAGWWVIGVDKAPQPDYCGDDFVEMDAVKFLKKHRRRFDAAHASPPCQDFCLLTVGNRAKGLFDNHQNLIPQTRKALLDSGRLWSMENVMTAPVRNDLELCGLMFGLPLFRHRKFELHGFTAQAPAHPSHRGHRVKGWRQGVFHDGDIYGVYGSGGGKGELKEWQTAQGIDWTKNFHSLAEAVPPAYGRVVGEAMMRAWWEQRRA
jgi:hypothetical protein